MGNEDVRGGLGDIARALRAEAQPSDAQPSDAQPSDAQPNDAQPDGAVAVAAVLRGSESSTDTDGPAKADASAGLNVRQSVAPAGQPFDPPTLDPGEILPDEDDDRVETKNGDEAFEPSEAPPPGLFTDSPVQELPFFESSIDSFSDPPPPIHAADDTDLPFVLGPELEVSLCPSWREPFFLLILSTFCHPMGRWTLSTRRQRRGASTDALFSAAAQSVNDEDVDESDFSGLLADQVDIEADGLLEHDDLSDEDIDDVDGLIEDVEGLEDDIEDLEDDLEEVEEDADLLDAGLLDSGDMEAVILTTKTEQPVLRRCSAARASRCQHSFRAAAPL